MSGYATAEGPEQGNNNILALPLPPAHSLITSRHGWYFLDDF